MEKINKTISLNNNNQKSLTELSEEFHKLESLLELACILGQQNDFQEILRITSLKTSMLLNAEITSIIMINPRTQKTVKTVIKEGKEIDQKHYRFVDTNVVGWVMRNNQPFLSEDIKNDSRFSKNVFSDINVKSIMCVSLQCEGNKIGYFVLMNKYDNGVFNLKELSLLEKLAAIAAPFLSNVYKIQEYFNAPLPEAALLTKYESLGLLGRSKRFIELLKAVEAAARCDVRVLLEGQSGTGKELIARAIHHFSSRKEYPFVAIDCGAIPENLIESELFGHVKGAFTGATYDRKGLFEEAHRGTFFIDEIANLSFNMQSKLLRVIQEGEIRIIGSNKVRKVDVRIISASSSRLRNLVENKQFRDDLYYRLHVYPIQVPSLNERSEDISLLANHFLKKFSRQQNKQLKSFHRSILNFMQQRLWEGNIRELENFIERLVTLSLIETIIIDKDVLPPDIQKEFKKIMSISINHSIHKSLEANVAEFEEQLIRQALVKNDWNQSKAARVLQISEGTIRFKMKRMGIIKSE